MTNLKMNKLTKEQIKEIKERSKNGETTRALAEVFKVANTTIAYHIDKEKVLKNQKRWFNKLSMERRREIYARRKEYLAKYMKKKYHENEEHREKVKAYQRNRYKKKNE